MASPVDVVIAVDGMEAEQARVTALFSDTLASDETTVEEQTNLMQTSRTQHECDDQSTASIAAVDTLADVPTGRHLRGILDVDSVTCDVVESCRRPSIASRLSRRQFWVTEFSVR